MQQTMAMVHVIRLASIHLDHTNVAVLLVYALANDGRSCIGECSMKQSNYEILLPQHLQMSMNAL